MRFAPFFFFLNFGLTWPFQLIQADSADTDRYGRYGPSRPDLGRVGANFGRVGADFSCVGPIRESPRGTTRHGRAVCGVPPTSPRRTRVRWPRSHVRASQLPTFMPRQNTNNSGKCFRKRPRRMQLTAITSSCPLSDLLMLLVSALMLP